MKTMYLTATDDCILRLKEIELTSIKVLTIQDISRGERALALVEKGPLVPGQDGHLSRAHTRDYGPGTNDQGH